MNSRETHFVTTKTARVFELGEIDSAHHLLVALHGYGQSAEYFIKKFSDLGDDVFIVCPEGLNQFYLKGTSGRVGTSWMTKENRTMAIADNQKYLGDLISAYSLKKAFSKITVLGFSQGGASAARIDFSKLKVDQLLLWACVFPPDISPQFDHLPENKYFVLGTEDEFFSVEVQTEVKEWYAQNGFEIVTYVGRHEIDSELLKKVIG